jgi:proline iminopeptidase
VRFLLVLLVACGSAQHPASSGKLAPGDHEVMVDGIKLAYHVRGTGPLCLVHGGGPGMQWTYLQMPEVESALTLVYLEVVGTGASGGFATPADYTLPRYAELLDHTRAALGIDRACVLGHSYGGMVALHWATAYPDHVGALILYDTAARRDADTEKAQAAGVAQYDRQPWFPAALQAFERETKIATDAEADAVLAGELPLLFADWTGHAEAYAKRLGTVHMYAAPVRGAFATRAPWDLRPKLAGVRAPTLVIVGARDWITPVESSDEIATGIAGATKVVLPNSGHTGHIEEPAAFAAAIATFATKLPR